MKKIGYSSLSYLIAVCFFLSTLYPLLATYVYAESPVNIYADNLEYLSEFNIYIAKGSVEIAYEDSTLNADEVHFNRDTADIIAIGNVTYEDTEVIIRAEKIELNLDTKLGIIYNSYIFYKHRNYHIYGGDLRRLGKSTYFMDSAKATTCNATPPEWHFKGENVKITVNENITARNAKFYIRNVPILYSPYFWAPLVKDRQTGLLTPSLGYSSTKGFTFKQGFFWALKENMDTTLYLDYYSKKGVGEGFDYRYIVNNETNGELWVYHMRDNDLFKDFLELKSYHNQKLPYDMSGYLKLHLVNEFDYYDVLESTSSGRIGLSTWESDPFGFASEERLQKYLESNLQVSKTFNGGRTYLLGQYRQSLEGSSETVPQSVPEVGIVFNTRDIGEASFNMNVTATNFWLDEGQHGQRLDIYPNFYLSSGRIINFTQKVGLRETLYSLENPRENASREIFDLQSLVSTRFLKEYPTFIHIIEPSIEYEYIPAVDQSDISTFDSTDDIPKTSEFTYSFTNRLAGNLLGSSEARLGFSQSYSLLDADRPYSDVLIETNLTSKNLYLSANASYDVYDNSFTETITSVTFNQEKGYISIGKNLDRSASLDQYSFEARLNRPLKIFGRLLPIDIYGKLWYDLKGGGVQELNLKSTYTRQCWGLVISFTREPDEYKLMLGIEFKGFESIEIGESSIPLFS